MELIRLENEYLSLEVLPECGGKLMSLYSKVSGREWLWRNSVISVKAPVYGQSYVEELDCGGWDEIFPSVRPGQVTLPDGVGLDVPDHGDVVAIGAKVDEVTETSVELSTLGRCGAFEFVRRIELDGVAVKVGYRVKNCGGYALPFLWSMHPLFEIGEGIEIEVDEKTRFVVESVEGDGPFQVGDWFVWGDAKELVTLGERRFAMKVFSGAGEVESVSLVAKDVKEAVSIRWEGEIVKHLGLWINYGGWCGTGDAPYFNVGIEPTTSPSDSLRDAIRGNTAVWLGCGEEREWSVRVMVSAI